MSYSVPGMNAVFDSTKLLREIEAVHQVDEDMPFWRGRIIRAMKNGKLYTTNAYSSRGSTDVFYLAELSARLKEINGRDNFKVNAVYKMGVFGQEFRLVKIAWDYD